MKRDIQASKILIPLLKKEIAPRFDMAIEALVVTIDNDGARSQENVVVLPQASAEQMCNLVLSEKADVVICNGIEEEHYQYLQWKKVMVFDSVVGPYESALKEFARGRLKAGVILQRTERQSD